MDINSRNLGQQEEDLDKKKFRKRASMSRSSIYEYFQIFCGISDILIILNGTFYDFNGILRGILNMLRL